ARSGPLGASVPWGSQHVAALHIHGHGNARTRGAPVGYRRALPGSGKLHSPQYGSTLFLLFSGINKNRKVRGRGYMAGDPAIPRLTTPNSVVVVKEDPTARSFLSNFFQDKWQTFVMAAASQCAALVGNISALGPGELRLAACAQVAEIIQIAQTSGNLKGVYDVVLAVSLDIANAFNSLPHETIREGLRAHGVPPYLTRLLGAVIYNITSGLERIHPRSVPFPWYKANPLRSPPARAGGGVGGSSMTTSSRRRLRPCGRPAGKPDPGTWKCPECRKGESRDNRDETPVRGRSIAPNEDTSPSDSTTREKHSRSSQRLSSSKLPWNDKEKPPEEEGSPRLYPILDKELQNQVSERRASWLTTKMLRKPLSSGNPDVVENSVRELGVRSENNSQDKENVDSLSMSEDENVAPRDLPPHPTGVKLTRPGYYTIPSLDEMIAYMRPDGSCVVPHLIIGRKNYGNIYYDCEVDVARLDLDSLVHFLHKEVIVYPNEEEKPPMGTSLNRRAIITLDRIWPRDKSQRKPITDPDRLLKMDYEAKLRRVCDKHDTKFIEYRPQTGSWVFRVEHFSNLGAIATPGGLSSLGGMLSPGGMPGLGGLATLGGVAAQTGGMDGSLYAMRQSSLNLLSGASKEDNADAQSFYQENRAFGVKSPTSELARLEHRQSHNVQLMKASLYADPEVEDDISLSTGDQQVPMLAPLLAAPLPMKPLIVQPHAIVLKYHRKVPPFKNTIAGKLDAACFADMSVSRARHSRVGFGLSASLTYVTSYDAVNDLPKSSDLSELGKYVRGRASDNWSESVVTRLGIGHTDRNYNIEEVLSRHLATLLEFTTSSVSSEQQCPLAKLDDSPSARREVLSAHVRHANEMKERRPAFGVTGAYCYEVWKLCEALWGADLDNDGIPGTDELAVVGRHKQLLEWFASAVADATDEELSQPTKGEIEDAADGHSASVWTLLLGGRVLEACRVARENGDLNMAILIAQAAGDTAFRSLVSRQLSQWRECDALQFVSSHRLATLKLVSGEASTLKELHQLDWLRAMHATARYLCPQVPSLEHIIKTYERFFVADEEIAEKVNLATVGDEVVMRLPLPDYVHHYEMTTNAKTKPRRVLDLRYELMRARALHARPHLQPASYTVDPSDYSLCFLLGTWFGNPTRDSITGVADQLEAAGAWHLAVQTLTYHPDDVVRSHLIRGVLSRHAPAKADSPEMKSRLELIRKLGVPDKWVLISQAHRAKYEHNAALEAEHLVAAGEWNAAHKVLIEELLPKAVLADDLQSISPILSRLHEAAQRHEVSGWESGGKALYHYLHVCDEIRDLVSSADAQRDKWSVQARLEALRPTIAAACTAIGGLQPKSAHLSAARAEMGVRVVQLALAAEEPPARLAHLLRALNLPPDCTAHALHKITSDLAEQASELCIESATSSPLSSHHRTAAAT
ncbi:hypothetical protein K1T71_014760, partial [Dendrolimus kikuchii]